MGHSPQHDAYATPGGWVTSPNPGESDFRVPERPTMGRAAATGASPGRRASRHSPDDDRLQGHQRRSKAGSDPRLNRVPRPQLLPQILVPAPPGRVLLDLRLSLILARPTGEVATSGQADRACRL